MKARIYCPAKTAMQSGQGKKGQWHIDFMEDKNRYQEPVMGWSGSRQTLSQLKLTFKTAEEAASFLDQKGISYIIEKTHKSSLKGKSYASNFTPDRSL